MFQNRIQYTVYSMLVDSIQFPNFLNLLWNLENFQEVISTEAPYQKFTELQTAALRVFKAPEAASMVEFLSSEPGVKGFSME